MPPATKTIEYRPDIDGLRAIAVLGVVFYHANLGFPGGYIGVDVFFVISGFLITSLLLKELRQGTFSLLGFWERRARRILPALIAVVGAILIAGWFLLLPADYEILGKQIVALAALSSNVKFWLETGYFAVSANQKPLLHTWSLSLEEQFYLLIPLLLWALFRLRKASWVAPVIFLVAVASFALSVIGSYHAPSATFFLLPMRAWELAVGSLLTFAVPVSKPTHRAVMAWCGLAAILIPFFFYAPGIRFPGLTALPPVLGTALLIWTGTQIPTAICQQPKANRLLASRPLVWIGLLSYSLYLWHWPLFAFDKYISSTPSSLALRLFLVVGSVMLAWFSLRFIERPFRSRAFIQSRNHVFGLSLAAVSTLMLISFLLWKTHGARNRLSPADQRIASGARDFAFRDSLTLKDIPDHLVQLGVSGSSPKVLVWGDSHAMAILPAVDLACIEAGIAGRAATVHSTPPVLEWFGKFEYGLNENSPAFNAAVLDYIRKAAPKGLSLVILAADWEAYLENSNSNERFHAALRQTVKEIQSVGCHVIILIDVPRFPFDPPRALALNALLGRSSKHLVITSAQHLANTALQRPILSDLNQGGAKVVDPAKFFTDNNGIISPADSTGALYFDKHHLSTHGSMRLKPTFSALIQSDI